jgi:hypothetical protein
MPAELADTQQAGLRPDAEDPIGGGPALDFAEWLALVQLHRSAGGAVLGPGHPAVVAASPVLAQLAGARGSARRGAQLRSPDGLARRLAVVRRMERGDTSRIPREASAAWRRFADDPAGAEELATAILRGEVGDGPQGAVEEGGGPSLSRGPVPFAGTVSVERVGGPEAIYLMVLEGALPPAAAQEPKLRYVKIGRSQDTARREQELNQGFPPGLGISWRVRHEIRLPSGEHAHRLEQAALGAIATRGMSIGAEFCIGAPAMLWALVEELGASHPTGSPLRPVDPTANARSARALGGRTEDG